MTRIEIAPELCEEAAFLLHRDAAGRGDPESADWLRRRERLYELRPPEARERAFHAFAVDAFRALGCDGPLRDALSAAPHAAARLDALHVRRARRAKEERAELYCAGEAADGVAPTRAVLTLRPERFHDLAALREFARRELLYVDDMVDPAFGYAPEALDRLELDPGLRDVVRERVGRAWKRRIEARARGERDGTRFAELIDGAVATLAGGRPEVEPAAARTGAAPGAP